MEKNAFHNISQLSLKNTLWVFLVPLKSQKTSVCVLKKQSKPKIEHLVK